MINLFGVYHYDAYGATVEGRIYLDQASVVEDRLEAAIQTELLLSMSPMTEAKKINAMAKSNQATIFFTAQRRVEQGGLPG